MAGSVVFDALREADLHVDRVYEGGTRGNVADDPIQRLLPVGNQGGFRYSGSIQRDDIRLVVLYTSGEDPDWPDDLDPFTGTVTYYGDNKSPGRSLHDTQRGGNEILRTMFERCPTNAEARARVPPVLAFAKGGRGRDVVFRGLAVPGSPTVPAGDDLVAVWRAIRRQRFQNYRATFTVLDEPLVSRAWIKEILAGNPLGVQCPASWKRWVERRSITPLISARIDTRSRSEQLPQSETGRAIAKEIHRHFHETLRSPTRFEQCAVDLWRMVAPATGTVDVTRPWRDGGRDAVGSYFLGPSADRLGVDFALEAKCYALTNAVGVREMSRLISRLRFRQFGVFVTTSVFNDQVYREVRQDQHPVVLICARDIVEVLRSQGVSTVRQARTWLEAEYPTDTEEGRPSGSPF